MHSFICPPVGWPLTPPSRGTHGNPGKMIQLWCFFYPHGEESCLILETTMQDHRDIPTEFVWFLVHVWYIAIDQSFFWAILLIFDAKFWYHVVGVHTFPLGKNYLSLFYALYPGAFEQFLIVTKNNSLGMCQGWPTRKHMITGKCITAEFKNIKMGPLQVRWGKDGND